MKTQIPLLLIVVIIISCVPFSEPKSKMLNPKTNYFNANNKFEITVISDTNVNADTLKSLLVVPNGDYFYEMGKNLGYFNEVMTYNQLHDKILELGDTLDLRLVSPDKLKLNKAAKMFKPFVIMKEPNLYLDENNAFMAGITIYDPLRGETIFQNKMFTKNSLFINNKKILLPLYNNFLDYLRKQK